MVDLFCGAGGFGLGFKQAGYMIVWANDVDRWAVKTYRENIARVAKLGKLQHHVPNGIECDVLIGSPPCQDFSKSNVKTRRENNELIELFLEWRDVLQPQFWVMEEVPPVEKHYPGGAVLDAAEFGVPQVRRRYFLSNFEMPQGNGERTTCAEALGRCEKPWWAERPSTTLQCDPRQQSPHHHDANVPGSQMKGAVKLSARDMATLMGFPRDFHFFGPLAAQYKQIGNAVCPPVARAIAERIKADADQSISEVKST